MTKQGKLSAALALVLIATGCGRSVPSPEPSAQAIRTADQLQGLAVRGDASAESQLKALAEAGDRAAQFSLAAIYDTKTNSAGDAALAAKWYRRAADQGDAAAQFILGLMYYNGEGMKRDLGLAADWLRLSAQQDFARAQSLLGEMYAAGEGVDQQYVLALMWLNLAESSPGSKDKSRVKSRRSDELKKLLTQAQIAQAKKLSEDWRNLRSRSLALQRAEFAKADFPERTRR